MAMGLKRLIKKGILGGGGQLIEGHIKDAIKKNKETGKPFRDCLEESVKETFTEDLPGTSHIYKMGEIDGRVKGTTEQANRDEKKIQELKGVHERDRAEWKQTDELKDKLIDDLSKSQQQNEASSNGSVE
ncbi:MAG: hypothetical protein IKZ94_02100 [Lachnospiraceae bacterium]|nr:hypothetical protein [Lachnospiraceae bacterium]